MKVSIFLQNTATICIKCTFLKTNRKCCAISRSSQGQNVHYLFTRQVVFMQWNQIAPDEKAHCEMNNQVQCLIVIAQLSLWERGHNMITNASWVIVHEVKLLLRISGRSLSTYAKFLAHWTLPLHRLHSFRAKILYRINATSLTAF